MCEGCGCSTLFDEQADKTHAHAHAHGHSHDHDEKAHKTETVELERKILSHNDHMAAHNREWLTERGIVAINLISAPGTGKTFLLEKTLAAFSGNLPCAVIVGDQETDNDARRLSDKGAPVCQIQTHNSCHLDAESVGNIMREIVEDDTKLLFIENIGNLVCPSAFDLGENFKLALMSVTEGEDKPVKYPSLFSQSPSVLLTKTDLIPHLDFDMAECRKNLQKVRPGVFVFEVSARTGEGMDAWLDYLRKLVF